MNNDEEIWVKYRTAQYEYGINLNYRKARVDLYNQINNSFDPFTMDSQYIIGQHITIAAIQKYLPKHPISVSVEVLIKYIKLQLFTKPEQELFTVESIASELDLKNWHAATMLFLLSSYGKFWDRFQTEGEIITGFTLRSNQVLQEYLDYTNFEGLLARRARNIAAETPITSDLKKDSTNLNTKKDSVFIVMPMSSENPELEDIKNTIKDALEKFGLKAFRIDDIEHSETITTKILDSIKEAKFIVADLSYARPNVYYEVGYAHALGHYPILIRKSGSAIHFDLSVHNIREYKNNFELKEILIKRFESILGKDVR
ncbi:hypothetical protein EHQ55_15195 [Leptospira meyeri]|uniref:hypothetical protein n=1 Tax=Leptospira meyeri TaxID=29508 RepID=UPI0010825429|nr:hypothetical protein [Leptospira meyeri]TGL46714.1 hypothetical protein EHQ55_15195 [Leptospira meyeri]